MRVVSRPTIFFCVSFCTSTVYIVDFYVDRLRRCITIRFLHREWQNCTPIFSLFLILHSYRECNKESKNLTCTALHVHDTAILHTLKARKLQSFSPSPPLVSQPLDFTNSKTKKAYPISSTYSISMFQQTSVLHRQKSKSHVTNAGPHIFLIWECSLFFGLSKRSKTF